MLIALLLHLMHPELQLLLHLLHLLLQELHL
jgi:hypothetical protein